MISQPFPASKIPHGDEHAAAAVIIPTIQVERLTIRCVEETRRLFPGADIVVLADIDDGADRIEGKARLIVTGKVTIAAKRNIGARSTDRPVLAFIDSDAFPQAGWLDHAVQALRDHPDMAAAAGPNVSPLDEPLSEHYVGIALRSVLGAHNAHYIKRPAAARVVDNMPTSNLVVRRDEYLAMGGMDESLYGGEDVEFCARLIKSGRRILYRPEILVFHKNRRFREFVKQRLTYGAFAVEAVQRGWNRTLVVSLVPATFALWLAAGLAVPFIPYWGWLWSLVVVFYLAVISVEAARHSNRASDIPGALAALVVATLFPGIGVWLKVFGVFPDFRKMYRNDQ